MSYASRSHYISTIIVVLTLTTNVAAAETREIHYRTIEVDKLNIFYREAGDPSAPTWISDVVPDVQKSHSSAR